MVLMVVNLVAEVMKLYTTMTIYWTLTVKCLAIKSLRSESYYWVLLVRMGVHCLTDIKPNTL